MNWPETLRATGAVGSVNGAAVVTSGAANRARMTISFILARDRPAAGQSFLGADLAGLVSAFAAGLAGVVGAAGLLSVLAAGLAASESFLAACL